MTVSVNASNSNPAYSLQSVLTAELTAVRGSGGDTHAPPPATTDNAPHAAAPPPQPPQPPVNLSAHGVGASVNHQG